MVALRNFNGLDSWRNAKNSLRSVNLTMPTVDIFRKSAVAGGGPNSLAHIATTVDTSETGGDLAHNNMPPSAVMNKIIKVA